MRIAIIAYINIGYGMGAMRRVTMLAQGLRDCGDEVHLVGATWGEGDGHAASLAGIRVHDVEPYLRGQGITRAALRRLGALRTFGALAREGMDWVFLYNLGLDCLPFLLLAKRAGCKVATDSCDIRHRGDLRHLRQLLEGSSYRLGDRIIRPMADMNIVVSSHLEQRVKEDAPFKPVHILPALIDTQAFIADAGRAREFRRRWSLGEGPLIAYVGGTQRFEGLDTLLRAATLLLKRGVRFRLLLAGEMVRSDYHDDLPALVRELRIDRQVLLSGRLGTQEVLDALSAADLLVVPKRDDQANVAGFPQKLVEYLAAGKPVVATAVGDVPRYLRHGENALLCPPDDPSALAETLAQLLLNPDLARRLGAEARKTAIDRFDNKVQANRLREACATLSGKRPSPQAQGEA